MSNDLVDLDEHRDVVRQRAIENRRLLNGVLIDQSRLRERQDEIENDLILTPATTLAETADKARYLIQLFAASPEAQIGNRRALVKQVIDELSRLGKPSHEPPMKCP